MINPTSGKITGAGAVVSLATGLSSVLRAKWIQVVTPSSNTGTARIGGPEVTGSTTGFPLPGNWSGMLFPPVSELSEIYDLAKINVYVAMGDELDFIVGG